MKLNKICDKNISFGDCELTILRLAVDQAEKKMGKRIVSSENVIKMIEIVENFIKRKNLICYGGTAINNILPKDLQFYDKETEIPDYDFFTTNALNDAKELADIYYKEGFEDVEAKSGIHHGTYKVFVNYTPVADITSIPKEIFSVLKKESIRVSGILYAPPNFLRMSMHLELSRPAGDISRWEKVLKRLTLLNKYYPITNIDCNKVDLQRDLATTYEDVKKNEIYDTIIKTFISQGVVFFGGYAISQYKKLMKHKKKDNRVSDFDVLSKTPKVTAEIIKERLNDIGVSKVKIIRHEAIGELVPLHYELKIGVDTVAFIYEPVSCHSYNLINIKGEKVKIATIDTILSFYLAFLYANKPYYNEFIDRTICLSKFLFDVQQENRLSQNGVLKRFSIVCYGRHHGLDDSRTEKAKKFIELKNKRGTKEFEEWFLNYVPGNKTESKENKEGKEGKEGKENKEGKSKRKKRNYPYTKNSKSNNPYNRTRKMKFW
jgi:hypothetical protein